MKALLVVAHGSRRDASNDEIRAVAAGLAAALCDRYQWVEAAFLELAEPSIPAAIDRAIDAGADEVVLFPYFLSAGRHVFEDIPAIVAERQAAHPRVDILLTPYLGQLPGLIELIARAL